MHSTNVHICCSSSPERWQRAAFPTPVSDASKDFIRNRPKKIYKYNKFIFAKKHYVTPLYTIKQPKEKETTQNLKNHDELKFFLAIKQIWKAHSLDILKSSPQKISRKFSRLTKIVKIIRPNSQPFCEADVQCTQEFVQKKKYTTSGH